MVEGADGFENNRVLKNIRRCTSAKDLSEYGIRVAVCTYLQCEDKVSLGKCRNVEMDGESMGHSVS